MMKTFRELVATDERMKKFKNMLKKGAYSIDVDALKEEVKTIHATRDVRRLKTKEVIEQFQSKVISARLQNQTYRSRLTEITVTCFEATNTLKDHMDALRKHMRYEYRQQLSQYRTKDERKEVIDNELEKGIRLLSRINNLVKIVEIILKDVDEASWMVKDITAVMTAISENRHAKL
jgi:hypothetical protein